MMRMHARLSFVALALSLTTLADRVEVREVGGLVGARMRACYEGVVKGENEQALVDVFKVRDASWDWKTEFWGKWMHSAPVLANYYGDDGFRRRIAASTAALIATQTPDGYIGNYPPEKQCPPRGQGWDVWGRKYTMLGLVHQYDFAGDQAALAAARRVLDHLMTQTGPGQLNLDDTGNYRGMPSMSVLEPVMWLYGRTHEERYLAYADYIVERMEKGAGLLSKCEVDVAARFPHPAKWWEWENGAKAYEMMSCYQGLLEYYKAKGSTSKGKADVDAAGRCLAAAVATGENIWENEINVCGSGASNECWCHGRRHQTIPALDAQECCVTVTWMRFCEALGRLTGEAKWADRFERTFYNAFLGALVPDGRRFAMYSALEGTRHPCGYQCGLKTNCCTANGPRGFVEFLNFMAEAKDGALTLNLYAPATVNFDLPCGQGALKVETDWPAKGEVALTLAAEKPMDFTVRLRVPGEGRYRALSRTWRPGERVVERLPLKVETVEQDGCVAFLHGPVVFARDARFADGDVRDVIRFSGANPVVREVAAPSWGRQALEADLCVGSIPSNPEESRVRKIRLVDYASAGNDWSDRSRYAVWLRKTFDPKVRRCRAGADWRGTAEEAKATPHWMIEPAVRPVDTNEVAAANVPKDLKLFLLIGQSNMAGRGPISAEDAAAIPNGKLVKASDLTGHLSDGIHFDTPSYRSLGARYYEAWKEISGGRGN